MPSKNVYYVVFTASISKVLTFKPYKHLWVLATYNELIEKEASLIKILQLRFLAQFPKNSINGYFSLARHAVSSFHS